MNSRFITALAAVFLMAPIALATELYFPTDDWDTTEPRAAGSDPDKLAAAFGALGRKCYIVPSLGLVVTRLGDSPETTGKPRFDNEFWRLLMEATPK
jgi:hypothetical protein